MLTRSLGRNLMKKTDLFYYLFRLSALNPRLPRPCFRSSSSSSAYATESIHVPVNKEPETDSNTKPSKSNEWIGKLLYNSYFASIRIRNPKGYLQKLDGTARNFRDHDPSENIQDLAYAHQNQIPIALQILAKESLDEHEQQQLSMLLQSQLDKDRDEELSPSQRGKLQFPYRILTKVDFSKIDKSQQKIDNQKKKNVKLPFGNEDDEMEVETVDQTYDWFKEYGTPDSSIPPSDIPCGGCGAILHCQDTAIPGYMPSERFKILDLNDLGRDICQRCYFLKEHDAALNVNISRKDYHKILSEIHDKRSLVLLIVDLLDFPCSIWPEIIDIIGKNRPVILVGNKVDLLPQDSPKFLNHVRNCLLKTCDQVGLSQANVIDAKLISATTGYGIENLITSIFELWGSNGNIYIMGCTNVGKSSLFNAFLQSDLCKIRAVDIIQRATISQWPGTTLNLLKFPVTRPSTGRLGERYERLREESYTLKAHKELRKTQLRDTRQFALSTLVGHVGQTFVNKQKLEKIEKFNEAKDLFQVSTSGKNRPHTIGFRNRKEMEEEYVNSKWCFDTPGAVAENQLLEDLTLQELVLTIPKEIIKPRTFYLKPGWTLFLAGLARVDYLRGGDAIRLTLFTTKHLPVTIVFTEDADYVYNEGLGSFAFRVPFGDKERLSQFPPLKAVEMEFEGDGDRYSCGDIVVSSTGWMAVTGELGEAIRIRAHTPNGKGLFCRKPSLLPYSVKLKGKRIRGTPAYLPSKVFIE